MVITSPFKRGMLPLLRNHRRAPGATSGRVMSICLHPFLIGHPFRSKHFDDALKHITSRQEVWITTGSEIIDW